MKYGRWKMARGWESKSIEDQIEEARRSQGASDGVVRSSEERERERKVESLKLERSRLTEQLNRARSETYQQMIRQSLKAIEEEIAALS
jgi:archaellum component FlaC